MRQPTPIWISHRGYSKVATENTREAFEAAREKGFRHMETDLQLTRDDQIVLSHDPDLKRTARKDILLAEQNRSDLEQIRLKGGERLYFFDQLFQDFPDISWTFDIKANSETNCTEKLISWATTPEKKHWLIENNRFLFWRDQDEQQFLHHYPNAKLYARWAECRTLGICSLVGLPKLITVNPQKTYSLPPRYGGLPLLSPSLVESYKQRGLRLLAFLPKTTEDAKWTCQLGVDEILTNHSIPAEQVPSVV